MLTKKLWVKFDDLDIECFCECNRKRCPHEIKPKCKEYVVKFIEIERKTSVDKTKIVLDEIGKLEQNIKKQRKKFDTELKKSLRQLKRFKI